MDESVVEWLLDGDVSIRYQTFRDLLDTERQGLRRRIAKEGWGSQLLSCQNPDGSWGRGFYQPKWTSSHYTLLDLKNLDTPRDLSAIRRSVDAITKTNKGSDGGINPHRELAQSDVCVNGMFLNYACYFQQPEESLRSIVDFVLREQMDDGGFNCRRNRSGARHSSLHSTLSVLEGIFEYRLRGYRYRVDELNHVASEAEEFILKHRLYKSDRTGEVINRQFLRLSYPTRWKYNVLRALDYFRRASRPWDSRMGDALGVVLAKRKSDGRWPLQAAHPGEVHFTMESPRGPSRWNTLIALRVIRAYGE